MSETPTPANVTGTPRWEPAREIVAQLREMPSSAAESEIENGLRTLLGHLFPSLRHPEIATQHPSGDGPIDVYCRNVVFETKREGKKADARLKADGSTETPEEQAVRYLDALAARPTLFHYRGDLRACITDGKEWTFYSYNPDRSAPPERRLTPVREIRLAERPDDDDLLAYLRLFVNRTVKSPPPTDDEGWARELARPFIDLAAACESRPGYDVKRILWRDVLRGAYLAPPAEKTAEERTLFAQHTMLVVVARAVAETIRPPSQRAEGRDELRRRLAEGFAAWLLDAAGGEGLRRLDATMREVDRYEWRAPNRDILKNLYHAVIPRNLRHDFGEYYTPDWLARAVCEEVLDAEWRSETIAKAAAGEVVGHAALDPACGSGTFLFHATQLLLEDARRHAALQGSQEAQVEIVNSLVAGMDLHPVAVELAKTTKMLALAEAAPGVASASASIPADLRVYLGDSLQWETRRNEVLLEIGDRVDIPTDDPDAPLSLPHSFVTSERFTEHVERIFAYADRPEDEGSERRLAEEVGLRSRSERESVIAAYRRFRAYLSDRRNHVWRWYLTQRAQPIRFAQIPATRLVGNPPWVVYNAMALDRQDEFRAHALDRNVWAGSHLATQNDLAATFVATCVDYYLATGGAFAFVLPYAALRARHWAPFRRGDWTSTQNQARGTHVDLSHDAWDMSRVNAPPFPQAHSSVVFGRKSPVASKPNGSVKPLSGVIEASGSGVAVGMDWEDVKPLLRWERRTERAVAPSPAYADAFRNGAALFPQPLVVFDAPKSQARGVVYFRTNKGKGDWSGCERDGDVEEQFVKPALFSRLLLPFGTLGYSNVIAPFAKDGKSLTARLPQGAGAHRFRSFWGLADQAWRDNSSGRPPLTLIDRIDYQNKLSTQLGGGQARRVAYQRSGSWVAACVVPPGVVLDGTLNWFASGSVNELRYLAAILNAPCLADFFKNECRYSDRHFQMLPVENLPIPAYDQNDEHHANLARQSRRAHERVAALVAERQEMRLAIGRNDILRDPAMQPILAAIDESARAILPDYCG